MIKINEICYTFARDVASLDEWLGHEHELFRYAWQGLSSPKAGDGKMQDNN